jgi:CHAT domain-containing protein
LALCASGRAAQADTPLRRATAAGDYLHPLSSIANLELGRLAVVRGDYDMALKFFEEASYTAVYYPDPTVLEEAFRYGAVTHMMANRKGFFPPLANAIRWAKANRLRQLEASLLVLAAENSVVLGQTAEAAKRVEEARVAIGRRKMAAGRMGARENFAAAMVFFQQKKIAEGEAALTAAMNYMRQGSLWLYHLGLADSFYLTAGAGPSTSRVALDLFQSLLRDPQPGDWVADPMESLAVLTTPHPLPFEHWFNVAVVRKDYEGALEVADRARRHRFFSSLALGGRLESLRWVLEGPSELLDQQAQLQRQDLLTRYPAYEQLRVQAEAMRVKLAAMPLAASEKDPEAPKKQTQTIAQFTALAQTREAILREMAVRREPANMVFPPVRKTADILKSMPKGHAVLVFFSTSQAMYGFLLNSDRQEFWKVAASPTVLGRQTVALLREMGNYQQNHEVTLKDLSDTKWKQTAQELLSTLKKGSQPESWKKFDELVIVPDGVLWYVPFEALQVEGDGGLHPLISRSRIRYAPTASLATAVVDRPQKPQARTGVVVRRLYPRQDDGVAQAAFTQLAEAVPGCAALRSPLPGPSSVFAVLMDRLIVLDDLTSPSDQGPYGWSPLPLDRGKTGGSLSEWMTLPGGHPAEIILPGFHTVAEEGLKRVNRAAPGNEVFLSVCGLMASGARTILLSRWRTGGQTSFDLVREFAQELPHTTAADAWQRAVLVVAGSRLNLDAEPRVKRTTADEAPRANHPFFWSGYLLVDSGRPSAKPEAAPVPPVLNEKKPEAAPAPPVFNEKKPEAAPAPPVLKDNKEEKP